MKIISTNIGHKTVIELKNRTVETGIFKKPVAEAIFLDIENVRGDTISDRTNHGGVDQAVYAYSERHYAYWNNRYDFVQGNYGLFGENLTMDELEETEIKVGSQYRCGEVILEVTKPRQPCYKLGLVFDTPSIIKDFWESTKSGVYFKVLQTGFVKTGDAFELIKEATNSPTIAEVYAEKRKKNGA